MVYDYTYGGGRRPNSDTTLIFIILFIIIIIFSFYSFISQPGTFSQKTIGVMTSTINFFVDIPIKLSKLFSDASDSAKRNIANVDVNLATGKEQIEGTADVLKDAKYIGQFKTEKVKIPLGFEIEAKSDRVTSVDGSLEYNVRPIFPSYIIDKFINEPIYFSCKPLNAKTSQKFHACQSKVDGEDLVLVDNYNKPFDFRCNFFDLTKGLKSFYMKFDFPMSQFGYKVLRIVNDPKGLMNRKNDIEDYVNKDLLEDSIPKFSLAKNSAGPLDIQFDIPNILSFDINQDGNFLELSNKVEIKLMNFPKGNLIGAELSFPKDSYIKDFKNFILKVPTYAKLNCGDKQTIKTYVKTENNQKLNFYEMNMDYIIDNGNGIIKQDHVSISCKLFVEKSYLIENNYNVHLNLPILFETDYQYFLTRSEKFNVIYDLDGESKKERKFYRDILFSIGRGGIENTNVELTKDQIKFKNYLIEKEYENVDNRVSCISINDFNSETKSAKGLFEDFKKEPVDGGELT
mgnify:CR=1 FL=1